MLVVGLGDLWTGYYSAYRWPWSARLRVGSVAR